MNVKEIRQPQKRMRILSPVARKNVLLVSTLSLTAIFSCFLLVIFWCTNTFRDIILSDLAIRNGSKSFALWQKSPIRLLHKIYIFNYTNVDDFQNGRASKLKVQQVGPYVYRETLNRVNIEINEENDTVTYQEERSFVRDGGHSEDEMVIVPNIPLLGAVAYLRDYNYLTQVGLTTILSMLQPKTFVELKAADLLWGYDDNIFKLAKKVMPSESNPPFDKFGILATKNGLSATRITMYTGYNDIEKLGMIQLLNGEKKTNVWRDERCDKIYGTDGSMFPPHWIRNRDNYLRIYAIDLCRNLPLKYHGKSFAQGMPSLRYKLPKDIFDWTNKKDSCFCPVPNSQQQQVRKCPPIGTFNSSVCNYNSPIIVSFPHFYLAESSLLQQFDGLKPEENIHETFLDLHPRLGTPISGASRLQINVEVRKAIGVPFIGNLDDGTILPVVWIDVSIYDIPEPILDILQQALYLAATAEKAFKWGSLLVFVVSISALYLLLRRNYMSSKQNEFIVSYAGKRVVELSLYDQQQRRL